MRKFFFAALLAFSGIAMTITTTALADGPAWCC